MCVHIFRYIFWAQFSFQSVDKYLAGLLSPGTTLTSASGFATLGLSSKVPFGPPQVNNPSIGGNPSETAIWSYDSFTKGVTGLWINQSPTPPTSLFIWYDGQKDTFYLTGSPNRPTSASSIVVCLTLSVTAFNH